MMEKDQEQRHVCKLCSKSFLSGKVLGGHMRGHLYQNSSKPEKKLRENPKKSTTLSSSATNGKTNIILCNVCGKGFESSKALFGHMRHHSGKQRKDIHCKECGKGFDSLRALSAHIRIHSERFKGSSNESDRESDTLGPVRSKRSKRIRYDVFTPSPFYDFDDFSSFTGIELEPDVKELVICLMMLSRGMSNWVGVDSANESLDNKNSASFEVKSSDENEQTLITSCVSDYMDVCGEMKDFEFYRGNEFKLDDESEIAESQNEIEEINLKFNEEQLDPVNLRPSKKAKLDASDDQLKDGLTKSAIKILTSISGVSWKKSQYKCKICNQDFHSYQALGGHKRTKKCHILNTDKISAVNSEENESVIGETEESKGHRCPICFKVFSSGQALGGHKRAHVTKNTENQELSDSCGVYALNKPTTFEEVRSDGVRLTSWYAGKDIEHEMVVSLVPVTD